MIILTHSLFSIMAFIVGTFSLLKTKGTKPHKILGWVFIISMVISSSSSFWIYHEKFSFIHILSLFALFWLARAIYAIRFKPKNWLNIHATSIGAAYIAIIIAGVGVVVRKLLIPGNTNAGYVASILTAIVCIYLLAKLTSRYKVIAKEVELK